MFFTILYLSYCACVAVGEEDEIERPEQGYEAEDFMLQISDNMLDAKNLVFTVQGEEFLSFAASIKTAEHSIAPSAWEKFEFDEMVLWYQNNYLSLYYNSRLEFVYEFTVNSFNLGLAFNKFAINDYDIGLYFFDYGFNSLQLWDKKEFLDLDEKLWLKEFKVIFEFSNKYQKICNSFDIYYVMENYIEKGFYTHNIVDFFFFQKYDFFDSYRILVGINKILNRSKYDSDEARYFRLKVNKYGVYFLKYNEIIDELFYDDNYKFFNILVDKIFIYKYRKHRIYSHNSNLAYMNLSGMNLPVIDLCKYYCGRKNKKGI